MKDIHIIVRESIKWGSLCGTLLTAFSNLPGTIYPGLMVTSAAIYHVLNWLNITIDVRNVCVFLAPLFSSLTTLVTYHLAKELKVMRLMIVVMHENYD